MEGLIPFLLHALKKQRPHHSYRSLSEGSSRSYHVLMGPDSYEGASHRRARSEFEPPTVEFLEQRSGFEKNSVLANSTGSGLRQMGSYPYQVSKEPRMVKK
ncbi:hypothetical protein L1049_015534 [Liquidambar formosana]|uniref:Uncharacterized protein n=1 Tax=Liquidambar formosana TaxID=63359 RepID=A0AAP0X672_LIQFO